MMNFLKKTIPVSVLLICISQLAFAQTDKPEMADAMRSNGKIYVVVAVCLLILFGLIAYVIRIDRRLSKMEQQTKD